MFQSKFDVKQTTKKTKETKLIRPKINYTSKFESIFSNKKKEVELKQNKS